MSRVEVCHVQMIGEARCSLVLCRLPPPLLVGCCSATHRCGASFAPRCICFRSDYSHAVPGCARPSNQSINQSINQCARTRACILGSTAQIGDPRVISPATSRAAGQESRDDLHSTSMDEYRIHSSISIRPTMTRSHHPATVAHNNRRRASVAIGCCWIGGPLLAAGWLLRRQGTWGAHRSGAYAYGTSTKHTHTHTDAATTTAARAGVHRPRPGGSIDRGSISRPERHRLPIGAAAEPGGSGSGGGGGSIR